MTMGPGDAVYERFGHNALVVDYDRQPVAFNYGGFSFGEQSFIWRFIRGRMQYWMYADAANSEIKMYIDADRAVWKQELNLSAVQRQRLIAILESQVDERYRYDYYTANCSTRIRDALDRAVDGQLKAQLIDRPAGTTYRYDTRRLMEYNAPLYTALYFILGHAVDRPISAWEDCYLPEHLRDQLANAVIHDEQGRVYPLVGSIRSLHNSKRVPPPAEPPKWLPWYLLAGVAIGAILALLALVASKHWIIRWVLAAVSVVWLFVVAFAGSFASFVWLFTSHVAAYRNENILQLSPLAIPLIVLVPALALGKRWGRKAALWIAVGMLGCSILGLALKALPWFFQDNAQMIGLALPAHMGLAAAVWVLSRQRSVPVSAVPLNVPEASEQ